MDGEVLDSESLVHVGDGFGDGVYDVGDLVGDDELDVLADMGVTLAANWSPINSPSLILMGPRRNYTVVWAYLKSGWDFISQLYIINHIIITHPARTAQ